MNIISTHESTIILFLCNRSKFRACKCIYSCISKRLYTCYEITKSSILRDQFLFGAKHMEYQNTTNVSSKLQMPTNKCRTNCITKYGYWKGVMEIEIYLLSK